MRAIPGAAFVQRLAWDVAVSPLVPNRRRAGVLRHLGLRGMDHPFLCAGISFGPRENVTSGPGCFLNGQVCLEGGTIQLGANVYIGPRAMILTSTHRLGDEVRRAGDPVHRAVVIGDGCWIGAAVTVLPGVTIGPGCVVAAGAVVTEDCAPHGLYAGVPAVRKRDLEHSG